MTTFRNLGVTAKPNDDVYQGGKQLRTIDGRSFIDVSAYSNGDVLIVGGPVSGESRIVQLWCPGGTPALAAANDCDWGFYKQNDDGTFTAVDADVLIAAADYTSAVTTPRDLLDATTIDRDSTINQLLSKTVENEPVGGYYVGLTFNVAPTTTDRTLVCYVVVEEATIN